MFISDIMTDQVISICEDEPVTAAARLMKQHNFGSLPVRDEKGKLKGILTDRDIVIRCVASDENPDNVKISEIMTRNLVTIPSSEDVDKAAQYMAKSQVRRIPVTDNGILVGIVALGDLARNSSFEMEAGEALSEISSSFRRR